MWEAFEPGSGRKSTRERLLCVISLHCNGAIVLITLQFGDLHFGGSDPPFARVYHQAWLLTNVVAHFTCRASNVWCMESHASVQSRKSPYFWKRGAPRSLLLEQVAFAGAPTQPYVVFCAYIPSDRRIDCTPCVNCIPFYTWRHTLHSRKARPLHIFACFSLITKFRRWKEGNWIMPNWQLFET